MSDLLSQLEQEHREVERLLDELEDADGADERSALLDELVPSLRRHMEIEERVVYPRLRSLDAGMAEEAEVEHEGARELLDKASRMLDRPGFGAMVAALKGAIAHHVEEEEDQAFPTLRDALSADELDQLGAEEEGGGAEVRGGRGGPEQRTRDQLYERAKELEIEGRSGMTRDELAEAVSAAERRS